MRNILFVVTCHGDQGFTGKGGHYYSLITIARQLIQENLNIHIAVVGRQDSEVVKNSGLSYSFIPFNGYYLRPTKTLLKRLIEEKNIEIIHSFDYSGFLISSSILTSRKIKTVFTKCGGPSPSGLYPVPNSMILFSKENFNFFASEKAYAQTKMYLIPNRVNSFFPNLNRCEKFKYQFGIKNSDFVIMRIARIASPYHNGIIQTLNLAALLRHKLKVNVRTIIIGINQDNGVYEDIKRHCSEEDIVTCSPDFTENSKDFLEFADIVVATGRGVMEASSLGKKIFIPSSKQQNNLPIPFNEKNFDDLFYHNLSHRNNCITNEAEVLKHAHSYKFLGENSFSRKVFNEYFDVGKVAELYLNVYENSTFQVLGLNYYLNLASLLLGNFKKFNSLK